MEFCPLHDRKPAILCRWAMMSVPNRRQHVDYCRIDAISIIQVAIRIRQLNWPQQLDEPIVMDRKWQLVVLGPAHVDAVDCPRMLMVNLHIGHSTCWPTRSTRLSILPLQQTTSENGEILEFSFAADRKREDIEFLKNGEFKCLNLKKMANSNIWIF